ncbi:hypothetical protein [Streptomyces sp. NPDC096013]|uniref:hypothetical protein n=1 Tax=Streptomyces sp. NPDC096013 TaxID=3366069 RepID=UPI0037F9733A
MTASSHQSPGPMPPERVPAATPEQTAAVFAAYGQVLPVPLGASYVDPVQAAAGVIAAAMTNGAATAGELAQAEADAGLLFDPQRAQDIAAAAAEQAHAEDGVEIAERGRQLAEMAGAQRQVEAVRRLIEGRPGWHHLSVAEIAAAVEYAKTAYDGSPPMTLTWTGSVQVSEAGSLDTQAVVECTSSYGGRAELVVDGAQRAALASLVDADARDIRAKCPTPGCGTDHDLDAADLFGWSRLQIASLGDVPRWYCCDVCVVDALARAGHETAADDLDARHGPGASDEYAAQVAGSVEAGFADERGDVDEFQGGVV